MNVGGIDDGQYERLKKAKQTGKYGHLETWKELVIYQMTIGSVVQIKEIGDWASRANRGEGVILPLMKNI